MREFQFLCVHPVLLGFLICSSYSISLCVPESSSIGLLVDLISFYRVEPQSRGLFVDLYLSLYCLPARLEAMQAWMMMSIDYQLHYDSDQMRGESPPPETLSASLNLSRNRNGSTSAPISQASSIETCFLQEPSYQNSPLYTNDVTFL